VPTLDTILFSFYWFSSYIALLFPPLSSTPLHSFTMNHQQDFLMPAEGIHIDSNFSFKPINNLGASSGSDSFGGGEPGSPTAIFRDAAEGLHHHYQQDDNIDPMSISPLQLALANPIYERRGSGHSGVDGDFNVDVHQDDAVHASGLGTRVISPYPFATQGELEERQQLSLSGEAMTWSNHMPTEEIVDSSSTQEHHQHERESNNNSNPRIDYSLFFQSSANGNANANLNVNASGAGMECDDFSISSHEAESIEDDLWLNFEKISGDPAAFWEEGMDQGAAGPVRVRIPSQDSSISNDSVRPIVSVGKVPRRR
jgi:hypothetical protein